MRENVVALLVAFGVAGAAEDPLLDLVIRNVEYRVLHETHTSLPMAEGLENVAVSLAVGEYLRFKKTTGQLDGFDFETAVKQLQEGDTNIHYAIGEGSQTPEQRIEQLILWLEGRSRELYRYRKLVW